ncbi:MAG: AMP-binding protein, partial [Acidimicrobiales bacterium]
MSAASPAPEPDPLVLHAAASPDRPAIIDGDRVLTFGDLNAEVNRLANGLLALGCGAGERTVWCGPNSWRVLAFIHAARKLGMVAVPLAYRFTAEEMAYVIDNSEATLVSVDAEQASLITGLRAEGRLPAVREIVVYDDTRPGTGPASAPGGLYRRWEDVTALGAEEEPPSAGSGGDSFGRTMIYTSGTTGKPKGAVRTASDRSLVFALLQELNLGFEEVHLTTGPLYHSGPNAFAVLAHALGGTVVIMRRFDPREWGRLVTRHRVTSTFSAPTQLKRIV